MQVLEYAVSFVGFLSGRYFDGQPVKLVTGSELVVVDKDTFLPHQRPEDLSPGSFEEGVWFSDPRDNFSGLGILLRRPRPQIRAAIGEQLKLPDFTVLETSVARDLLRPADELVKRLCEMSGPTSVFRQLERGACWDGFVRMPAGRYQERGFFTL